MTTKPGPAEYIVGTDALKGLAHPLRMALLTALYDRGSATASQLAFDLGESSGATSYHLRQLHRHGFVQEDPAAGTIRERYWIPRPGGWTIQGLESTQDAASVAAVDSVLQATLQQDQRRVLETVALARQWPKRWRDVTRRQEVHLALDATQLRAMLADLDAIFAKYKAAAPGDGARRVTMMLTSLPSKHLARR